MALTEIKDKTPKWVSSRLNISLIADKNAILCAKIKQSNILTNNKSQLKVMKTQHTFNKVVISASKEYIRPNTETGNRPHPDTSLEEGQILKYESSIDKKANYNVLLKQKSKYQILEKQHSSAPLSISKCNEINPSNTEAVASLQLNTL